MQCLKLREGSFYLEALEKWWHSERALTLTLAEMYKGVSTRIVAAILEQMCGSGVTSSAVSPAVEMREKFWSGKPLPVFLKI